MRTETPAPERASTLQGLTCLICQASLAPALRSDAGKRSERHEDTARALFACTPAPHSVSVQRPEAPDQPALGELELIRFLVNSSTGNA